MGELATLRPLREVVEEFDRKLAGLPEAEASFTAAKTALEAACRVGGAYGGDVFGRTPYFDRRAAERGLLQSAWKHVYEGLNIRTIAPLADRERFERELQDPPPFTIDNIAATFGDYVKRPRFHILRGLAEIFCGLDPAYKSHSKIKVGVAGLPKRVILTGFESIHGYGRDKVREILNALAAYQGKPMVEYTDLAILMKDGDALREDGERPDPNRSRHEPEKTVKVLGRDVWLKRFHNGNGHLFFGPKALADINRALAEFYGDVLPDTPGDEVEKAVSTAVARDLQYYPTPRAVIDRITKDWTLAGKRILEPSCGDGRIMEVLRQKGGMVTGIEIDPGRIAQARAKGFPVLQRNFLEVPPDPVFDMVVMNPPFYGKHYAKHVSQATKWLKPGGTLTAILPITARLDHDLLNQDWAAKHGMRLSEGWHRDGAWEDLPVGSFAESGTNINTTVFSATKQEHTA